MNGRRILIVEDEEILIRTFSKLLNKKGYETSGVHSGSEAIRLLGKENFSLMVCDVRMPGLDGFETLRQIRERIALQRLAPLPVIWIILWS